MAGAPRTPLRTGVMAIAHAPGFLMRIRHVPVRFFVVAFVATVHEPLTLRVARGATRADSRVAPVACTGVALIVYVVSGAAANVATSGSSVVTLTADSVTAFSGAGGSAMLTAFDGRPLPTALIARSLML